MQPRDYQTDAATAGINALKRNINPVICAATGLGKSVIIGLIAKRLKVSNTQIRVMVATHVAELLTQNAAKLKAMMPDADIGFYSAGLNAYDLNNDFLFCGIQSIFRVQDMGKFQVLIIDEVHSLSRKDMSMWHKLISTLRGFYPNLKIIGLSATPWRMDSGSLVSGEDALFDEIVFDYGLGRGVQDGWLCRLVGKGTQTKYNIEGVRKSGHDYNQTELEAATNTTDLNTKAVLETLSLAQNRKRFVFFCNGVSHARNIRDTLLSMGVKAETIDADTPTPERDRIFLWLREESDEIRCVTNYGTLTTGVDVPNIDCIVMLRHTLSEGLLLQMAGRGTRVVIDLSGFNTRTERLKAIASSKKPDCLFLDFAGNIRRHGFLDQIEAKDKKKKGEGVAPMKECPACFSILHAAAPRCRDCGHVFEIQKVEVIEKLHDGGIMGGEPEVREVMDITYNPHNLNKPNKTPCMMVAYMHPDMTVTKEYICLMHEGFAKTKALKWWSERGGESIPEGADLMSIISLAQNLKVPSHITVKQEGKYERITHYKDLSLKNKKSPISESSELTNNLGWFDDDYPVQPLKASSDDFDIPF